MPAVGMDLNMKGIEVEPVNVWADVLQVLLVAVFYLAFHQYFHYQQWRHH
jgi:hypothetical protein